MVRQREILSYPLFDHATITGEKIEQLVIAIADEAANLSSEFKFEDFFQESLGIIGLAFSFDGHASDTITVVAQFKYGNRTPWGLTTQTVMSAKAANTDQFQRIDIQSGWRDYLPFEKIRFTLTKSGTNGACTAIGRIVRL